MKRFLKISISTFLFIGIIGLIILHFASPYLIIKPHRVSQNQISYLFHKSALPSDFGFHFEEIFIQTKDSFQLKGYYIPSAQNETFGSIIYLHGISGCKESFVGLASNLANKGYEGFVFDSRAHGESGGNYCTFGYYEKEDVSQVIDFLEKEKGVKNIGVWGASMGGAVALQSLEFDKRLKFGIVESTFHDLLTIIFDYKKRWSGIGIQWMAKSALSRAAEIADFDYEKIKPGESAKSIYQPVFYAHGDIDANISVEYGKEIFENLASTQKELLIVEGAGHHNLGTIGGENYFKRVLKFLEKNVQN